MSLCIAQPAPCLVVAHMKTRLCTAWQNELREDHAWQPVSVSATCKTTSCRSEAGQGRAFMKLCTMAISPSMSTDSWLQSTRSL